MATGSSARSMNTLKGVVLALLCVVKSVVEGGVVFVQRAAQKHRHSHT